MLILPLAFVQIPAPLPFLSPTFSSHMVLQRDRPNTFWGWTTPGSQVTVTVDRATTTTTAGEDGKWVAKLTPPKVGGPYTVLVDGTEHVKLEDVLVGDVWLCTGQSNMEMGITLAKGGAEAVAAATDPNIRLFIAPHQATLQPSRVNGGNWRVCSPETVAAEGWGGFSAVGYFFGKAIRADQGIPIGLVGDYWGGTNAESWASKQGLRPLGDFNQVLQQIEGAVLAPPETDLGDRDHWELPETDVAAWKPVNVLGGFKELGFGDEWDGTVWYRKEFTLTADQAASATSTLTLGAIDDMDTTWINGKPVGSLNSYNTSRSYPVASGILREGKNVLVVKVLDTAAFGGFSGPAEQLVLTLAGDVKVPLQDGWVAIKGAKLNIVNPNIPTVLSNGMLDPIMPLAIKGAIWYQGENNAGRAEQYQRVLPAMIADWRQRFGQGDFPFYIVSLANFMARKEAPGTDEWAELREAQALTAATIPNSGLAISVDVGDAADIHPTDKKTVGERLALIALARDYGRKIEYRGPTYKSFEVKGSDLWVTFDHADGLTSRGGAPGEFAIAGEDQKWHWAKAEIFDNAVVLSSPDCPRPVAVRYAWQSNPLANLYNAAGLPMVPFRTDNWPRVTAGRK